DSCPKDRATEGDPVPTRRLTAGALCATAVLVLAPIFTASPALAAAGQSVVTGRTAAQLVQEMVGTGIAGVSNATFTGAANANGIFSGMGGIGIDSGIVLSTGAAAAVMGPNISGQTSTDYGAPGDASLTSLAGGTTYDAAI